MDRLDILIQKLQDYCSPKKNVTVSRYYFNTRNEKSGEKFDTFLTSLKTLAKDCEYRELKDSLIKDRIVCGVDDNELRKRLLQTEELTLDKAVRTCKVNELSSMQLESSIQAINTQDIDAVRVQGSKGAAQRGQREYANNDKQACVFCTYQHKQGKCPAWNQKCIVCGLQGHFAKSTKCKKNKMNARSGQRQVHDIQQVLQDSDDECSSDDFLITEVTIDSAELIDTDWYETLSIGSTQVKFKLDTGAQTDLLPTNVLMSMHECNKLQPSSIKLKSYSGHVIKPDGQATLRVKDRSGKLHEINFQIEERGVPILVKSSCVSLGLIKRVTEEQSPEVKTESQSDSAPSPVRQVSTYGVSAIENSNKPSKRCLDIMEKAEKKAALTRAN